jgi:hypothetical protein
MDAKGSVHYYLGHDIMQRPLIIPSEGTPLELKYYCGYNSEEVRPTIDYNFDEVQDSE